MAKKVINKRKRPTKVLAILKLNRSTYYSKNKPKQNNKQSKRGRKPVGYSKLTNGLEISDEDICKLINNIKNNETEKDYGYKKVTKKLQRKYKVVINKKKTYRIMKEMKLIQKKRDRKIRTYSKVCRNHKVNGSNQLWETDIKYVHIAGTRKMAYILSVIDVFDRSIVGYVVTYKATAEAATKAVLKAYINRNIQKDSGLIIRTDNGTQYLSHRFTRMCKEKGIHHERIPVHSPNYNAHIESYHRILKDECVGGKIYMSLEQCQNEVNRFVYGYNHIRIHSSIDYYSPHEFYLLKNNNFKDTLIVSL